MLNVNWITHNVKSGLPRSGYPNTLLLFRGVPNWFEGGDTLCPFKVGRLLIMYCTRILAFPLTDHVQQDFCTPGLYTVLKVTLKSTCLICSYTELFPRVLLGIFGGGVPPGSPNPDHISDQKMSFSPSVFRSDL